MSRWRWTLSRKGWPVPFDRPASGPQDESVMLKRLSIPVSQVQSDSPANWLRHARPPGPTGLTSACLLLLASVVTGWSGHADSVAGAPFDLQQFIDTELRA